MKTRQVIELGGLFTIMTTFDDGYTSPMYYPKNYTTRKGAERQLQRLKDLDEK